MTGDVADLLDYDHLRRVEVATAYVASSARPTVVLGSSQSSSDVNRSTLGQRTLRRRRGGGGAVLLGPGDLWVDWWLPREDPRWIEDVHASAVAAGQRWVEALSGLVEGELRVHRGRAVSGPSRASICFAGRGPGELFVNGAKAVGVTQWRVREGALVSSILPAHRQEALGEIVGTPVAPGDVAHHTVDSLGLVGREAAVLERVTTCDGPWRVVPLTPLD